LLCVTKTVTAIRHNMNKKVADSECINQQSARIHGILGGVHLPRKKMCTDISANPVKTAGQLFRKLEKGKRNLPRGAEPL